MTEEKLLTLLKKNNIPFVLIGGTALTLYGSTRVTIDTDIAVKTLDVDRIISLFYDLKFKMVIGVDKNHLPEFASNKKEAKDFSHHSDWGFLKFMTKELEIDVLYDIPVPFMHLVNNAVSREYLGIDIDVACLDHLKLMKENSIKNRDDDEKRKLDEMDLKFINKKRKPL